MSFTKRVYQSRNKIYLYGTGSLVALFTFLVGLSYYGITIDSTGDITCAGTIEEPCIAFINITTNRYAIVFPKSVLYFGDNPPEKYELYKKDTLGRWRAFNISGKTMANESKWELKLVVFKKINESIKWGIKSGIVDKDPVFKGYSKDNFMPTLTRNEVFFDHGEAEFPIVNPLSYNVELSSKYFNFLFNNVKGYLTKFEIWVGTEKNMSYNETTQVWIPNITITQIISSNGTFNKTQDNGYFNKTTMIKSGTETIYSLLDSTQKYTLRPKEQVKILIKGYWDVKTVYRTGISIDWFPNLSISGVNYVRNEWAWWNVSFSKCRQIDVVGTGTALTDYQVSMNITYDSDMQADFDDIRFANGTCTNAGTELSYWIEQKVDSSWAQTWIKVPSVAASGNTTLAMYYNASVASGSNINNTMVFGDDFEGYSACTDSAFTNKWTRTHSTGSCTIDSSISTDKAAKIVGGSSTWEVWKSNWNYTSPVVIKSRFNFSLVGSAGQANPLSGAVLNYLEGGSYSTSGGNYFCVGGTCGSGAMTVVANEIYTSQSRLNNTFSYQNITRLSNNVVVSVTNTAQNPRASGFVEMGVGSNNRAILYYYYFVRKFSSPEPTLTVNAEENLCFQSGTLCGLVNSIYLNGTNSDRYYELGDQSNITATVNDTTGTGQLCLTIDHPDFGTNFTCGINGTIPTDYFTSIIPALNTFNDSSKTKTISPNSTVYFALNKVSQVLSSYFNLNGTGLTDVYIDSGDNGIDAIILGALSGTNATISKLSTGVTEANVTFSGASSQAKYITLPMIASIKTAKLNISSTGGSVTVNTFSNGTSTKTATLSPNSNTTVYVPIPLASTITSGQFNISATSYNKSYGESAYSCTMTAGSTTGACSDTVDNDYSTNFYGIDVGGQVTDRPKLILDANFSIPHTNNISSIIVDIYTAGGAGTATGTTKTVVTSIEAYNYTSSSWVTKFSASDVTGASGCSGCFVSTSNRRNATITGLSGIANVNPTLMLRYTLYVSGYHGTNSDPRIWFYEANPVLTIDTDLVKVDAPPVGTWDNTTNITSGTPKIFSFNSTNLQNYLNICGEDPCQIPFTVQAAHDSTGTSRNITTDAVSFVYSNNPKNITIDVGQDGTTEYSYLTDLNSTTSPQTASLGGSAFNSYLSSSSCSGNTCNVPVIFSSKQGGNMTINAIEINYTFNPVNLNYSSFNSYLSGKTGTVTIPVGVNKSSGSGSVTIDSINISYYGDANYTVTANYTDGTTVASTASRIISIIWSNYTLSYPSGVSYFQFFPKTVNSTNVTPYGQSSTTPFINITGTQRDRPFNLYVRVNASYVSTANLTVSNSSTKGTNILTTSWIKLVNNLTTSSSNGLWFWLDLFNINNTALRFLKVYPEFESKCDLCVQ